MGVYLERDRRVLVAHQLRDFDNARCPGSDQGARVIMAQGVQPDFRPGQLRDARPDLAIAMYASAHGPAPIRTFGISSRLLPTISLRGSASVFP